MAHHLVPTFIRELLTSSENISQWKIAKTFESKVTSSTLHENLSCPHDEYHYVGLGVPPLNPEMQPQKQHCAFIEHKKSICGGIRAHQFPRHGWYMYAYVWKCHQCLCPGGKRRARATKVLLFLHRSASLLNCMEHHVEETTVSTKGFYPARGVKWEKWSNKYPQFPND